MKTGHYIITTLLMLFLATNAFAQRKLHVKKMPAIIMVNESKIASKINLGYKSLKKEVASQRNKGRVTPKLSMDILEGKGIHVLTISNVNFLPTMRIGVEFNAKLIITI